MKSITITAPAKLNLTLDVLGRDDDTGFHRIESIMHRVDIHDTLTLTPADTFSLEGMPDIPPEENIITKAFSCIRHVWGEAPGVRVHIEKRIPQGAGMGGGSSDAAAFVRGYYGLWGEGKIPPQLHTLLAETGKDIPFFLADIPCALATGYGEIITPLPWDLCGQRVFVGVPDFQNNTAELYSRVTPGRTHHTKMMMQHPDISHCGSAFDFLWDTPAYQPWRDVFPSAHITGTGSAFFGFQPSGATVSSIRVMPARLR